MLAICDLASGMGNASDTVEERLWALRAVVNEAINSQAPRRTVACLTAAVAHALFGSAAPRPSGARPGAPGAETEEPSKAARRRRRRQRACNEKGKVEAETDKVAAETKAVAAAKAKPLKEKEVEEKTGLVVVEPVEQVVKEKKVKVKEEAQEKVAALAALHTEETP